MAVGPFAIAWLKVKSYDKVGRQTVFARSLQPLLFKQVCQAGLGTVSEKFDGDPPHAPRGCTNQVKSVVEPLSIYIEDVLQIRPKYEKSATAS